MFNGTIDGNQLIKKTSEHSKSAYKQLIAGCFVIHCRPDHEPRRFNRQPVLSANKPFLIYVISMQAMPKSIEIINKYFILICSFNITLKVGEGGTNGTAFILIWIEGSFSPYPILFRSKLVYFGSKHSAHHFCAEYIAARAILQLSPGVLMNFIVFHWFALFVFNVIVFQAVRSLW